MSLSSTVPVPVPVTLPNGQRLALEIRLSCAPETLLKREDLAARLQVSVRQIDYLVSQGMPRMAVGKGGKTIRYSWTAVMGWIQGEGGQG